VSELVEMFGPDGRKLVPAEMVPDLEAQGWWRASDMPRVHDAPGPANPARVRAEPVAHIPAPKSMAPPQDEEC
jgi:hypothetical protein